MNLKVTQLKAGDKFKLPGQRKFRTFLNGYMMDDFKNLPQKYKGKYLVILDDCRQIKLDKETMVEVTNL